MQAYSNWLYVVPWGFYKAVTYVKEKYNNPVIIIGENGKSQTPPTLVHLRGMNSTTMIESQ